MNEIPQVEITVTRFCPSCGRQYSNGTEKFCPHDQALLAPVREELLLGQMIGQNYRITNLLSEGAWGKVYLAQHLSLPNLQVAVKVLHPYFVSDADKVQRFQHEAEAASRLSHPNIVRVQDFGLLETGQPFLVLEYASGQTLSDYIKAHGRVHWTAAVRIVEQCCAALSEAHSQGIIHRDIKPSNLMVCPDSNGNIVVRVLDFGLAKITQDNEALKSLTGTGEVIGTPAYMSPEQCMGHKIDHRSDIYSLGCILYEMVTGRSVVVASNALECLAQHLHDVPPHFDQIDPQPQVPTGLESIVFRCLEKDPERRFQTAQELLNALKSPQTPVEGGLSRRPSNAGIGAALGSRTPSKLAPSTGLGKFALIGSTLALVGAVGYFAYTVQNVQKHDAALQTFDGMLQQATVLDQREDYSHEEEFLQKAYTTAREKYGAQSSQLSEAAHRLGSFYLKQKRTNRAEADFEKSLAISDSMKPRDVARIAALAKELGDVYMADNRPNQAETCFRKALECQKQNVGDSHPATADAIVSLADSLIKQEKYAQALEFYKEAENVLAKCSAPNDVKRLQLSAKLALLYDRQNNPDAAEATIKQALDNCDDKNSAYEDVLKAGAAIYTSHKNMYKAEALCRSLITLHAAPKNAHAAELSANYVRLAEICAAQKKLVEAEANYRKALEADKTNVVALQSFAQFLRDNGRASEADKLQYNYAEASLMDKR